MQKTAGLFFFLSGSVILLGILTAEIFYPGEYSIPLNMISNLGSTPPPDSIIHEPSATIFDLTMILSGTLTLIGSFVLYQTLKNKPIIIPYILMGIGTAGVGFFPAFHAIAHPITALLAFLAGGISAIASYRLTKPPFSFLSILLGVTTLVFLLLGTLLTKDIVPVLGRGGTERWVLYPLILWMTGFGGYLMSYNTKK